MMRLPGPSSCPLSEGEADNEVGGSLYCVAYTHIPSDSVANGKTFPSSFTAFKELYPLDVRWKSIRRFGETCRLQIQWWNVSYWRDQHETGSKQQT
jgi:hypothetical protein